MNLLAQATIPTLPGPPLTPRLLLEEPLLLTGILIVLGVAGFVVFNAQGKVRLALMASAAGFLLAAGVQVLALIVETPREKLLKATTGLVTATAHADVVALSPMLDPKVHLSNGFNVMYWPSGGEATDRDELLARVREYIGRQYPLKECAILETLAVVDGPGIGRSQVRVRAVMESWGVPIVSWWRIEWREGKEGWMATDIQPLDLGIAGVRGR